MRAAAALAAGAVFIATLSSCMKSDGGTVEPLPPPPSTIAPQPTTIAPDFSGVALPKVRGATTTTTISIGPGEAAFKGTVTGPEGPIPDATVRVERLLGGAAAARDVVTLPDGTWQLPGIRGGAYRVRAWRAPDLALVEPAFIFIGARQVFPLELKVERYAGPFATAAVAPNPPVVGPSVNLAVQLSSRSVDERGFVVAVPLVGVPATVSSATGTWQVVSANPTLSDTNGRARWELRCRAAGTQPIAVVVDAAAAPLPLTLPPCVEPVTTPAPGATSPASSSPSSSAVTLVPGATTTTTRPPTATTTRPPTATTTTVRSVPNTTRPR